MEVVLLVLMLILLETLGVRICGLLLEKLLQLLLALVMLLLLLVGQLPVLVVRLLVHRNPSFCRV